MRRRKCEFEIFQRVEEAVELPNIRTGFIDIDDFVSRAQTILQRRKSRSGRILELHVKQVFIEENLQEGRDFSHQPTTEAGKKPDFLFPFETAYRGADFPSENLRILAVKTSCKDRWRQVIDEAERIPLKHLFTLQEGVSKRQFEQMTEAGVRLVIPEENIRSFPIEGRGHLKTLESFIGDVRLLPYGLVVLGLDS